MAQGQYPEGWALYGARHEIAAKGLPTVRPADFSTGVMQRTIKGRSGAQWFFSAAGRAFTLHVVLGSHGRRAPGAVRLQALLDGTTIGKL
mgnify:CR=1 FL=1